MYRKLVRVYVRDLDAERLAELKEGLGRAAQNPEVVCAQR